MKHQHGIIDSYTPNPNLLRYFAAGILSVFAVLGVFGGLALILEPEGSKLGLSISQLNNTPFKNYIVPGILLLIVVGLDSFVLALFTYNKLAFSAPLMIIQGAVVIVWIVVEFTLGFSYPIVQIPAILLAIGLAIIGTKLIRYVPI